MLGSHLRQLTRISNFDITRKVDALWRRRMSKEVCTRKVFEPAFGETETSTVKEEKVTFKRKTPEEIFEQIKDERKVRKLTLFDKVLLVFLGKYKRIQDVPNEITFMPGELNKLEMSNVRDEALEKGFKAVKMFELTSFFLTFGILIFAVSLYASHSKKQSTEKEKANLESETKH